MKLDLDILQNMPCRRGATRRCVMRMCTIAIAILGLGALVSLT